MVPGNPAVLAKIATPHRYQVPVHMAKIAGEIYGGKVRTQPELAREFARTARLGSALGYFYQMLGVVGWTSIRWLRKLRQPTLILHGDDDPLVPQVNAKIMHRLIPRAKLYIFHDGHLGLGTSAGNSRRSSSSFSHRPSLPQQAAPDPHDIDKDMRLEMKEEVWRKEWILFIHSGSRRQGRCDRDTHPLPADCETLVRRREKTDCIT
jgi:alpha/beta hydrolase family protein